MNFFREQIKEEPLMGQIIRSSMKMGSEEQLTSFPFILCSFQNPPKQNLCFSNVVTSLILNIPVFQKKLSQINLSDILEYNGLIKELNKQADLPKFSKSSTARFRYLVKGICIENGQATRNFSDNKQNDAGSFFQKGK